MEYLDVYNEKHQLIGTRTRKEIHELGLWHDSVHIWLYDKFGCIYFQKRLDSNKYYTTCSGHVNTLETIENAIIREVHEELGLNINLEDVEEIGTVKWQYEGTFIDKAFVHVYLIKIDINKINFKFQEDEVLGLIRLKVDDVLNLFLGNINNIYGQAIENKSYEVNVGINDFLMDKDVFLKNYGFVFKKIKDKTSN